MSTTTEKEVKQPKQISKTEFINDVKSGMFKSKLMEKYGMTALDVSGAVKSFGLKLTKERIAKFLFAF